MKEAWQHFRRWLELVATAMDHDPIEELFNRVATLEREVAEIKNAGAQDRAPIR